MKRGLKSSCFLLKHSLVENFWALVFWGLLLLLLGGHTSFQVECGSFCFAMEKLMHLQTDHALWYEVKGCLLEKLKKCVLRTKVYFSVREKRIQHPLVKKDLANAEEYRCMKWGWVVSSLSFAAPAERLGVGSSGHMSGRQAFTSDSSDCWCRGSRWSSGCSSLYLTAAGACIGSAALRPRHCCW